VYVDQSAAIPIARSFDALSLLVGGHESLALPAPDLTDAHDPDVPLLRGSLWHDETFA
jgi:hypothetical protein